MQDLKYIYPVFIMQYRQYIWRLAWECSTTGIIYSLLSTKRLFIYCFKLFIFDLRDFYILVGGLVG